MWRHCGKSLGKLVVWFLTTDIKMKKEDENLRCLGLIVVVALVFREYGGTRFNNFHVQLRYIQYQIREVTD